MNSTNRNNGLDLLRTFSSFAVVLLHVNAIFLFQVDALHNNGVLLIENIINLITRFCVPCFVMISGRFLLENKDNKNTVHFYKKSLVKIGIPYVGIALAWIVILFCYRVLIQHDLGAFIKAFIRGSYGNLWFMPMLFGLYLLTPFLIRMVDALSKKEISAISVVFIIWTIISQPFSDFELPYSLGVVVAFAAYFLLGYALKDVYFSTAKKLGGYCLPNIPTAQFVFKDMWI